MVKILDPEGKVLEQDAATQVDSGWWEYGSSTEGQIEAEAWDLAGNKVVAVL